MVITSSVGRAQPVSLVLCRSISTDNNSVVVVIAVCLSVSTTHYLEVEKVISSEEPRVKPLPQTYFHSLKEFPAADFKRLNQLERSFGLDESQAMSKICLHEKFLPKFMLFVIMISVERFS